ncbi:hypothetical protein GH714_012477 [Hevea brasiliensis]|uniref:K Homology domain-containing protein n=1 Tax=Hevea brasiliensis TaxID=3981 RepID=A0A6A6KNW1_HEVBR|nr:hypothetical protein GH714_012477 [Hevea brasiliensis]
MYGDSPPAIVLVGHRLSKTVLKESDEEPGVENEKAESAALPPSEGVPETTGKEEPAADGHYAVNTQQASVEDLNTDDAEKKEESEKHSEEDEDPVTDNQTASRKMEVPNDKADACGSPSLVARGLPSAQTGVVGGDAIKALQAKSGARIQLIPQHLPEGDGSKERTVRVTGDRKQIEMAREMIKDVMNQTVRSSPYSGSFNQQHSYRPRGPTGPSNWGPRGPHSSQPNPCDYHLRGPYPSQSSQYPPPSYGGYPPQQMGPEANYNYGQPHGPDYGHQAPYSQAVPSQQGYGHGYDEPKYDNHAPMQHPYGHGSSQPVYPQASNQPGYRAQQQYGKQPSCGMPLQGPPPQSYGPPRPSQLGDMPYQGPIQSSQSYGPNVPPQQQYPYASSGQSYPSNGSASGAEGNNQAMPTSGPGYPQQGSQPVPCYLSLVDNSQLAMCKVQPVVIDYTHLRNNVIQNSQLQTMQVMGIKGLKILLMAVALGQPIVHHQVASRLMLSQQQLNQVMISGFLSQVHMELLQEVHQLGMGKTLSP